MKLIGSMTSPYVRKVRIVLAEKKIECAHVPEDVWSPDTTIKESNPLGKVPCLVMEDGGAVFDSRVIVEYLDTINPVNRLIPQGGRARVEVRCWEALADGICDAAILARLESNRPAGEKSQKWIDRQLGKVDSSLAAMARGLEDKPWCSGNAFTLADVACGMALGYLSFRFAHIEWRKQYPNLARLDDKLSARQSFIDTAPPAA
jgi:glutathione S-transferase